MKTNNKLFIIRIQNKEKWYKKKEFEPTKKACIIALAFCDTADAWGPP